MTARWAPPAASPCATAAAYTFAYTPARYTFWPEHAAVLTLHYFCAVTLLGGQLTALAGEGFHSVCGFVNNKHRAALLPDNVRHFSLARVMLRRLINEDPDLKQLQAHAAAEGVLDPDITAETLGRFGLTTGEADDAPEE